MAKAGEAIVKIKAFGLNRMDLSQREGGYPVPPQAPKTLGVEFSGTIESFGGEDHCGFTAGEEVFGLAYGGAYAEYIAVATKMLLPKPGFLGWEQAAGIPETWITATQALHFIGEFAAGKTVLWHAGASGVSIAGIQLSRSAGAAAVYATAGSQAKCDFIVGELGATEAFNYRTQDWAAEILERTGGKGVDIVIDYIAGDYFQKNLDVAARDARIVCLAFMGGSRLHDVDIRALLMKRLRIEGSSLRSRDPDYQGRLRDKLQTYIPLFEKGELEIKVDKVFPWEKIIEAHEYMASNSSTGKIICTIS